MTAIPERFSSCSHGNRPEEATQRDLRENRRSIPVLSFEPNPSFEINEGNEKLMTNPSGAMLDAVAGSFVPGTSDLHMLSCMERS